MFHVTSPLIDYIASLLPSLLNLLECSSFLLFKQTNTICKQTQIVFSPLSGKFSGYQLLMESSIVIFFVWCQVNVFIIYVWILLIEFTIIISSRTSLILIVVHLLKVIPFVILFFSTVTVFLCPLIILLIVLHIIKKLIIYIKNNSLFDLLKLKFIIVNQTTVQFI